MNSEEKFSYCLRTVNDILYVSRKESKRTCHDIKCKDF